MTTIRQRTKEATESKPRPPKGAKHFVEYASPGGHTDKYKCICGWESQGYWDFAEAAWDEWLLHAFDTKTEVRPIDYDRLARLVLARKKELESLQSKKKDLNRRIARLKPPKPGKKK